MELTSLPTLYEYYAGNGNGINYGLNANQSFFTLNGKNISIYSGAMHYFRVPKQYWRSGLRKLRAAGLNAVETYVPWNLHEPQPGVFDFGNGGTDMEDFLDLPLFLNLAKQEDLFAIVRPGPFICAEWEFGGLPSWLLQEEGVKVRTSDEKFMKHVRSYFSALLNILTMFQFTNGGSVIAFQIENEYANFQKDIDLKYLNALYDLFIRKGIKELLFTSDSPVHGTIGTLPDKLLHTANFDKNPVQNLDQLNKFQRNKPTMVMEYWSGWFDHWAEPHQTRTAERFKEVLEGILSYKNASVNMYMFHGGTNFGFLNGANDDKLHYQPTTTSYDYDSPISENGDYTEKYFIAKRLIEKYNPVKTKLPELPETNYKTVFTAMKLQKYLPFKTIIELLPEKFQFYDLKNMESLPINNGAGQSYGYTIYRKDSLTIQNNTQLLITGNINDMVMVLINHKLYSKPLNELGDINKFGFWILENSTIIIETNGTLTDATLDLVVLNMGRNNFGPLKTFNQIKGLSYKNKVFLNDTELHDWTIIPLEFKKQWTDNLENWEPVNENNFQALTGPAIFETIFYVDVPTDTYIDMSKWNMGIVIVNGFVLGRYMHLGPQQTLYLPASLQITGYNSVIIFEHFIPSTEILFSNTSIYSV